MNGTTGHPADGPDSDAPGMNGATASRKPCAGCAERAEALSGMQAALDAAQARTAVWIGACLSVALGAAILAVVALLATRERTHDAA